MLLWRRSRARLPSRRSRHAGFAVLHLALALLSLLLLAGVFGRAPDDP
jgi:hypothetical protein